MLQRAGTQLSQAGSNLTNLQRASTLPLEDGELRHGATMPILYDVESYRPWCWGLWKTQQLIGFVLAICLTLGLEIAQPLGNYSQAVDMLAITLICACFWVFEVIPINMTALIPLVAMPFAGIMSSEMAASSYWDYIQVLVIGTFLLDIALEQVFLPRRIVLLLLLKVGVFQPPALLAVFMGLSWAMSMVCNNIAVTLIITPFAIGLVNAAEEELRDELAAKDAASDEANDSDEDGEDADAVNEVQRLGQALLLGIAYSSSIGGMATLTGSIPNYILGGQSLLVSEISWLKWFLFGLPLAAVLLVVAYLAIYVRFVHGLRLRLTQDIVEQDYSELERDIGVPSEELYLKCFTRDELAVGFVQLLQIVLLIIRPFAISPYLTTEYGQMLVNDATLAVAPALLLFFIPSMVRNGQSVLTWPEVHEKFDFGLLLLIGGGYAIAEGFKLSQLNTAIGDGFAHLTQHVHPLMLNLTLVSCVSLMAQLFSTVGTASTVIPMMVATSLDAVLNPMGLVLPATVASSMTFTLPTACPPNVVVLAKSQEMTRALRVRDFVLTGLPINLLACVICALLLPPIGSAVFRSDAPMSESLCDQINCRFLNIPGYVGDREVEKQACILELAGDGTCPNCCKLWNGTIVEMTAAQVAGLP